MHVPYIDPYDELHVMVIVSWRLFAVQRPVDAAPSQIEQATAKAARNARGVVATSLQALLHIETRLIYGHRLQVHSWPEYMLKTRKWCTRILCENRMICASMWSSRSCA